MEALHKNNLKNLRKTGHQRSHSSPIHDITCNDQKDPTVVTHSHGENPSAPVPYNDESAIAVDWEVC
jgi:hypothetical protein